MRADIERHVARLVKRGYSVEERGECLLVALPGQHLAAGVYVSKRSIEDSGDPAGYLATALSEAYAT